MVIPLLALLLALLFSVVAAGAAKLEVIVEARNVGWQRARETPSNKAFRFAGAAGVSKEASTRTPRYTMPGFPAQKATAELSVSHGVWDHRELLYAPGVHHDDVVKVSAEVRSTAGEFLPLASNAERYLDDFSAEAALSHISVGNVGELLEMVEEAAQQLEALREAAEEVFDHIKKLLPKPPKLNLPPIGYSPSNGGEIPLVHADLNGGVAG